MLKEEQGCWLVGSGRTASLIDIDLLILPDDLRRPSGPRGERMEWNFPALHSMRRPQTLASGELPVGGILLDIHWFSLRHARWRGVDDVLWQGAGRAQLGDEEILLPSPEDFLVHTIAHGRRAGSPGSLWKQDVRALLEHPELRLDWDRVARTVQNYRVAPMVAAGLEEIRKVAPIAYRTDLRAIERASHEPKRPGFSSPDPPFFRGDGFVHPAVVALDFARTRPCRGANCRRSF